LFPQSGPIDERAHAAEWFQPDMNEEMAKTQCNGQAEGYFIICTDPNSDELLHLYFQFVVCPSDTFLLSVVILSHANYLLSYLDKVEEDPGTLLLFSYRQLASDCEHTPSVQCSVFILISKSIS
jgi:hypothetical protein